MRILAAGVNPIDTKLRQRGTFYPEQMPAILGCDGAGIVEAVGNDVQKFGVGDEVYFCYGGLGAKSGSKPHPAAKARDQERHTAAGEVTVQCADPWALVVCIRVGVFRVGRGRPACPARAAARQNRGGALPVPN